MATEIATAYISLVPSASRIAPAVTGDLRNVESAATRTEGRVSGAVKGALRGISGAIVGITAAVGGMALSGGISRALAIDNATAKMRALGYSSEQVTSVMDTALASVKGTAFGLGDAASLATQLIASGIKPGQDLARALGATADMAAVANVGLGDLSGVMGQMAGKGRLYTEDLMQLGDRGLPVFSWLAESAGVSQEAVRDMVTKGKLDFADLQAAIEQHIGGAAKNTDSFQASLANVRSALGRIGATVAAPGLAMLKGIFDQAIPVIDTVTARVQPLIDSLVARLLPAVQSLAERGAAFVQGFDLSGIAGGLSGLLPMLAPLVGLIAGAGSGALAAKLGPLGKLIPTITGPMGALLGVIVALVATSPELRSALGDTLWMIGGVLQNLLSVFAALAPVVSVVADIVARGLSAALNALAPVLVATQAALVSIAQWLSQNTGVATSVALAVLAGAAAWKAWTIATQVWSVATQVAAGVQKAFNAVMNANPVMLVVTAIAALVAGLVYFFTQTETGRQAWAAFTDFLAAAWARIQQVAQVVWSAVQAAVAPVVEWFQTYVTPVFAAFGEFFSALFERIGQVVSWLWTNAFQPTIDFIVAAWQLLWGAVQAAWDVVGPPLIATIKAAFQVMSAILSGIWNGIRSVVEGVWNAIKIVIQTALNVVRGIITAVTAVIRGDWSGAWNAIKGVFSSIWDGMTAIARNAISTLGNIIGGIKDTVLSVFSTAGNWLRDIGRKIIDGLVSGIKSAFGKVRDALSSLTNLLPDWKGPAEVDAKLLTGNGRLIMQSLIGGFEAEEPSVRKYLRSFTADLGSAVSPSLAVAGALSSGSGGTTVNATVNGTNLTAGEVVAEIMHAVRASRRGGRYAL